MTHELVMPQLGMTMTEGTVLQWLKSVGDAVAKGEPIVEIQTDKVDMEVESPFAGYLTQIAVAEGTTVPVAMRIGCIGDTPDAVCETTEAETGVADASPSTADVATVAIEPPARQRDKVLVSPRARRVAAELGVTLDLVTGSGEFGRIREQDVRAYAESARMLAAKPAGAATQSSIRKVIAQRLTASVSTVPQFWLARAVDASALVALRAELLPEVERRVQARLSYTDFFLKSLALAMEAMPEMKQIWGQNGLEPACGSGVGFAAQAPDRLVVPVVADAANLSLSALSAERARLVAKAQDGRLTGEDMEGASGTLSNLGAFGVDEFQAIINPPQSCILATGRIVRRPIVAGNSIEIRSMLQLVLTVDHRVADGVLGARFLSLLAEQLENPASLLV